MKKRERIIALCMALLLGVTSIVWDFGRSAEASGEQSAQASAQSTQAEVPASVKFDFESITDVSVLDKDFTAHQSGVSGTDSSVADNWFSGKTATGADSSQVNGLKVKKRTPGNAAEYRYLKYKQTYTNFHAIIEMYPDANTYVNIGHEPDDGGPAAGNSDAFMFWFSSTTQGNWRGGGRSTSYYTNKFKANQSYTLHIVVEDGTLTAWIDEVAGVSTSFTLGSAFTSPSSICLRQRRNKDSATAGGMNGGFKSLEIHNLDVAEYTNFNYIDTTKLDAAGYKATQFNKSSNYAIVGQDQTIGTYWFSGKSKTVGESTLTSGNAGLKPLAKEADNKAQLVTTPYTYEHFELATEIHYGKNMGIIIGTKNVYPRNASEYPAFSVYFANNRIQLGGALDFDTATATGTDSGGFSVYQTNTGIFYFDKTRSNSKPMVADGIYTLNIRKSGEDITIWVDGYDSVLTLRVADHFENGNVSLMAHRHNNEGGGFKSLTIKELDAPAKAPAVQAQPGEGFSESFVPVNSDFKVTDLNKEFSSYYFSSSTATGERGKVSDRWNYTNQTGVGLKPKHNSQSGARTMLTYDKYIFNNVEVVTRYAINWVDYSVMIAPQGEMASVENHGIKAWVESDGKIRVTGAIDAGTASATGGYVQTLGQNMIRGYKIDGYSGKRVDGYYTLHVKIDNGMLYIWMDEIAEYVISVKVTDDYQGGLVSLYSTGNNSGGYGTFSAVELQDTTTTTTAYTQSFNTLKGLNDLKDFKAYTLDSVANQPKEADIDDIFRLNNGKLQAISAENGKNDRTNFSILTLDKKEYKNFELTLKYEQARMQRYGVMFGTELGEFAYSQKGSRLSGNSGAYVYTEAEGYRNVRGALMASSYTTASEAQHRKTGKPASFWWFNTDVMNNVQQKTLHTMTIRVVDDAMTMVIDNDESTRTTVRLDGYEGGYISLVSDAAAGDYGAFLYLAITELGDDAQLETALPELSDGFETMKQVDELFDAYYLADAKATNKLEKVDLNDHWWLNNKGFLSRSETYSGTDAYTVTEDVEILTYTKQKFTDFEMTYTYQQTWGRLGVILGEDLGEYPLKYVDGKLKADNGALYYLEIEGRSNVQGNLNNWTKDDERKYRVSNSKLVPEGFQDITGGLYDGKEHLVKLVVKDKQLYVFLDGNEEKAALHVFLGDDYKGGYVSLFAHANKYYGFNHFSITDKVTTKLPAGSGTSSSGSVFTADFDTTKLDTSAFKTYYLEKTKGNATGQMKEDSFENQWTLDNGVLESNTQLTTPSAKNLTEFEWDDCTKVSVLTYNKKLTDFIVSYDYTKSWYRPMFMFGTELGKFALNAPKTTQYGQGVLIYPENDLGASGGLVALGSLATYTNSMRPMNRTLVKVEDYHEKGNWNSNVGTMHTMTVAVISGHCYIYLDDYGMIADYALDNYKGGYVSLATTGRNYQYFGVNFDNLRITDLSNVSGDAIASVTNPSDVTVKVGTKVSDLQLPTSVKVTLKNGKTANAPVKWVPLQYNPDKAGVYQFTAEVQGNNPAKVGARLYVKVVEKMPTSNKNVKQWTFDTPQDLKDFKATYLKNAEKGYVTSETPNWYVNSSGKLTRDPFRSVNGDQYKELAILTYTGEKYTNFELEVEYTQQWQRMMVLFGSDKPGEYINLQDIYAKTNPVAGFVEMEGVRNFIGNLINANFDSNDKEKINNARESGIRLEDYYDKVLSGGNQGKKHTMKIRVMGDQAMMWVDNCEVPYVCTLTDYDGGYISLVMTSKSGSFDNLKITRLGATPAVEVKEQQIVANGTVGVDIDESADTKLVVPERVDESDTETVMDGFYIPPVVYIIGGSTILLASLIGTLFILLALKKKKQKEEN